MGKASRKLKKKQQQEENVELQAEVKEIEQKLFKQLEDEAYSDVLDTLVELTKKNSVSPQAMYAGAYAYFMLGDYDRAATWIDNTLRFAPNHVAARILLARLCILQDKVDNGLAIFDLLTDKFLPGLSEEERDEIDALSGFYGRNEPDKIKKDYPHLAAFLHIGEEEENVGAETEGQTTGSVMGLKLPSIAGTAKTEPTAAAKKEETQQPQNQEAGKSALSVLRSLKEKIDARVHGAAGDVPTVQPSAATGGAQASPSLAKEETRSTANEARAKLWEICEGKYSVSEKVRLLNSFAGGYYVQGNLETAELFLTEALKLDETDGLLRNLAVLLAEKGEQGKAIQAAARMRQADFLLLQAIRDM